MAESGSSLQWTIVLVLTALLLSVVVVAQIVSVYTTAYLAAPHEVATFIDAADFSVQENESYDRDVSKVQRLEDRIRLGQLLREIQKGGDDLREALNAMVVAEGAATLKSSARLLWASKRSQLEDRVRRLDLLRMRFLVVYMGVIAGGAKTESKPLGGGGAKDPEKMAMAAAAAASAAAITPLKTPTRPTLPKGLAEGILNRPPLRRLTTQGISHSLGQQSLGHSNNVAKPHARSWADVVTELQMSPKMQKRHASIEEAMARATRTP